MAALVVLGVLSKGQRTKAATATAAMMRTGAALRSGLLRWGRETEKRAVRKPPERPVCDGRDMGVVLGRCGVVLAWFGVFWRGSAVLGGSDQSGGRWWDDTEDSRGGLVFKRALGDG